MKAFRTSQQSNGPAAFVILLFASCLQAGSSTNYTLAPEVFDHGGQRGTSANYTLNPSTMPGGHGASASYTLRSGFAGQLMDAIATDIRITAVPLTVDEGGTRQLGGTLVFDDLSTQPLAATSITWSIQSGPLANISTSGLATAASVHQNTPAVVQGTYQSLAGTIMLTVLDTLTDNFGGYAADGIDDGWQVLHFGQPPNLNAAPAADPDFDGQDNFFEFTAGTGPGDANSFFRMNASPVPGVPGDFRLTFSPRLPGRGYVVQSSTTLQPQSWVPLAGSITTDDGETRTVTDTGATGARKMYRVEITRP